MGCLRITHDQRPELRVVHAKKGVASNDWVKRVRSSYLFGMLMPGRHQEINGNPYTYGFNGMERDEEVKGAGNSYDFGARMQDPRLGRWLSIDPLAAKYPAFSPYNFALNTPIWAMDPDGRIVEYANAETKQAVESAMAADPKFAKSIQTLINSDVVYVYSLTGTVDYNKPTSKGVTDLGATSSDGSQINIGFSLIENSVRDGKNTALYHETEHGLQFEHGELGFKKNASGEWVADASYDINDEVKAFEAGMEAPGSDQVIKDKFKNKSPQQKINYVAREGDTYNALKKQAQNDEKSGKSIDRNYPKSSDGQQKTVKTETHFFKSHKDRQE